MSLAQSIAPHLPYLRRYGRAISGSQASGDALVAKLLETLVSHPDAIDAGGDLRIQLYRMIHDNFGVIAEAAAADEAAAPAARIAAPRLPRLPSPARPPPLLTAVAGLSAANNARP